MSNRKTAIPGHILTSTERSQRTRAKQRADPDLWKKKCDAEAARQKLRQLEAKVTETEEAAQECRQYEAKRKALQRAKAREAKALAKRGLDVPSPEACINIAQPAPTNKNPAKKTEVLTVSRRLFSGGVRIKPRAVQLVEEVVEIVDVEPEVSLPLAERSSPSTVTPSSSSTRTPSSSSTVTLSSSSTVTPSSSSPCLPPALRRLGKGFSPVKPRGKRLPKGPGPKSTQKTLRDVLRPRAAQSSPKVPLHATTTADPATDCYVTAIDGPCHGKTLMPESVEVTQSRPTELSYTPRRYDKQKEQLRWRARVLKSELARVKMDNTRALRKERRRNKNAKNIVAGLQQKVQREKCPQHKKSLMDTWLLPTKVKKDRLASELSRVASVSRKSVKKKRVGRVRQQDLIKKKTQRVMEFFKDPQWGLQSPNKKDVVSCRSVVNIDGQRKVIRTRIPKIILQEKIKVLHAVYNQQNPDLRVSFTFFKNIRRNSQFVKCLSHAKAEICICQKHQNYALKLRALRRFTKMPSQPDTIVRDYTVETFAAALEEANKSMPDTVTYEEWKKVPIPFSDPSLKKVVKKLRPVLVQISKDKLVKTLVSSFPAIKSHVDLANHQHRTVRNQRHQLKPLKECTIQMDFAQNWLVAYGQEIQAAYFAKDPVTIHPAVIHYRNAQSVLRTKSLCMVSDDRKHDAGAVMAMVDKIVAWIKENLPEIETIHFWSDSPSSQYRNIKMFSVICRHVELFGISCAWSYFESGHGKGPCDGVGAAAKFIADLAIKAGGNITNAAEFVANGMRHPDSTVNYLLVTVSAAWGFRDLLEYVTTPRKVPGTLKVHDVMVSEPGTAIVWRQKSCYDDCCWDAQRLVPVMPQPVCKNSTTATRVVLYTKETYASLEKKRVKFLAAKAAEEKKSELAAEKEARRRAAAVEKYEPGDWVAAVWGDTWWVGEVESEAVHEQYSIKFMHPVDGSAQHDCFIDWPETEDIEDIPAEDIMCVLSKPTRSKYKGAPCFTLPKMEVINILDRFDKMCL